MVQKVVAGKKLCTFHGLRRMIADQNVQGKNDYMLLRRRFPHFPRDPSLAYPDEWKGWVHFWALSCMSAKKLLAYMIKHRIFDLDMLLIHANRTGNKKIPRAPRHYYSAADYEVLRTGLIAFRDKYDARIRSTSSIHRDIIKDSQKKFTVGLQISKKHSPQNT